MQHKVKQGECLSSVAARYGFNWDNIWNHPGNAALKRLRQDPNILMPGDLVHIPDKKEKTESCATGQRHRFRKQGVSTLVRIKLMDDDEPRSNENYTLIVDGQIFEGKTDSDGIVAHDIDPEAKKAKLLIGDDMQAFELDLGKIDPVDEISGLQARLNN